MFSWEGSEGSRRESRSRMQLQWKPRGALRWLLSEVQSWYDSTGSLCPTLTSDRMASFPGRSYIGRSSSLWLRTIPIDCSLPAMGRIQMAHHSIHYGATFYCPSLSCTLRDSITCIGIFICMILPHLLSSFIKHMRMLDRKGNMN